MWTGYDEDLEERHYLASDELEDCRAPEGGFVLNLILCLMLATMLLTVSLQALLG